MRANSVILDLALRLDGCARVEIRQAGSRRGAARDDSGKPSMSVAAYYRGV